MKKRKMLECPYNRESCINLNTATMTLDVECCKCKNYNNGIVLSRGIYIPDFKSFRKKLLKWIFKYKATMFLYHFFNLFMGLIIIIVSYIPFLILKSLGLKFSITEWLDIYFPLPC